MGLYDYRHIIANERTCYWLIRRLRWPEGVRCPACQGREIWVMRERGIARYRGKVCRRHFSLRTGTVFERSRRPLTTVGTRRGAFSHRHLGEKPRARTQRGRAGGLGVVAPASGRGATRCIDAPTPGENRGG